MAAAAALDDDDKKEPSARVSTFNEAARDGFSSIWVSEREIRPYRRW